MSYAHQARPAHRDRTLRRRRPLALAAAVATALTGITGLAGGTAVAVPDDDRAATTATTDTSGSLFLKSTGPGPGTDSGAPSVPGSPRATGTTADSVSLTWQASTDDVGVTGYDVYRGGSLAGTATSTTYADTGLTASTAYSYTVKARDAAGNTSGASVTVSATTQSGVGAQIGRAHV